MSPLGWVTFDSSMRIHFGSFASLLYWVVSRVHRSINDGHHFKYFSEDTNYILNIATSKNPNTTIVLMFKRREENSLYGENCDLVNMICLEEKEIIEPWLAVLLKVNNPCLSGIFTVTYKVAKILQTWYIIKICVCC